MPDFTNLLAAEVLWARDGSGSVSVQADKPFTILLSGRHGEKRSFVNQVQAQQSSGLFTAKADLESAQAYELLVFSGNVPNPSQSVLDNDNPWPIPAKEREPFRAPDADQIALTITHSNRIIVSNTDPRNPWPVP